LAKELGATTAVIADADVATSVIAYARNHNLSKLVIGRDPARRLWPWQRSSGQKLAMLAPDIDLVEIGRADGVMQNGTQGPPPGRRVRVWSPAIGASSNSCGIYGRRWRAWP